MFEDSPIGFEKWLPGGMVVVNCKNGISYEMARDLGVTQKCAWFMLHRVRTAMKDINRPSKIGGPESEPVEVDEAFVGGKVGNMHKGRVKAMRAPRAPGSLSKRAMRLPVTTTKPSWSACSTARSRQVRAKVIPNTKRETLQREILSNVKYGLQGLLLIPDSRLRSVAAAVRP